LPKTRLFREPARKLSNKIKRILNLTGVRFNPKRFEGIWLRAGLYESQTQSEKATILETVSVQSLIKALKDLHYIY
jgi:hypothetical protein